MKVLFIGSALFLTGCAATVQRDASSDSPLTISSAASKRVIMVIEGSKASTASEDWEKLRTEWRNAMQEAAKEAGIFLANQDTAATTSPDAGTLLTVTVNDFRYVSQGARLMGGIMTGNAFVDADVSFMELPAKTLVGTRKYKTSSSAGQGIFAPMTAKQIRSISDQIINEIRH